MRVKIGNSWYSDEDVPICVEFSLEDMDRVRRMPDAYRRYAAAPEGIMSRQQLHRWINAEDQNDNDQPCLPFQ